MTRTNLLLTILLVVGTATVGLSGGVASSAETTYQQQDGELADAAVGSGDVFWQGQFLSFTGGADNASTVWAVHRVQNGEVGGLVTEVLLGENGSAVIDTAGLDGQFVIVDDEDRPLVFENGQPQRVGSVTEASFEITAQSLDATFGTDTVANDDSPDSQTDLEIQSNRAGYEVSLFAEQLSASELASIFPAAEAGDDRAVVTRNVGGNEVLDANFTGVEPGTYNVTVVAADGTAEDTATITVVEPVEGEAGLSNDTIVENRGDVARFNVTFDGTDRATVEIGSTDVFYLSRFTVVDEDGDGQATVEFDSFRAGQSADAPGISVVGEDSLTDAELRTDPLSTPLESASYPVEVSVGARRTAVGVVQLTERSTGGMATWTAPETVRVGSVSRLAEVATQESEIAYQDWAIVQVEASGLYSYVENVSDLNDNETGLSMSLTRLGEINVPPESVSLESARLLTDDEGDQFFVLINTNALNRGATYEANFTVSDANPYVEEGNATTLTTNFTVVERNVTFDEPVEAPASSEATISGSSSVAPGTELDVEVSNVDGQPFLERATVTVGENGTWEATVDLSDVSPGTNFSVEVAQPAAETTGVVVEAEGGAEADAETETVENETTENETVENETTENETTPVDAEAEETTPAEEDAGANETTPAEADDNETTPDEADGDDAAAAEEETTAEDEAGEDETTTPAETTEDGAAEEAVDDADEETTPTEDEGATAPAPGFGPTAVVVALLAVLAVGVLATRRN